MSGGGGGGGGLFDALPDELLKHVLSFLPSREAVQSSILSRRWRHLWRSTPAVRVRGTGDDFRLFVNSLIVHRDTLPLHSFDIDADLVIPPEPSSSDPEYEYWRDNREVDGHMDLWPGQLRAVRKVPRPLTDVPLGGRVGTVVWPQSALTFTSPHLTTVHLDAVHLVHGLLDFSCA
ncbi:hypothetical protein ACQ4PT_002088 [Festuca glaucescens]